MAMAIPAQSLAPEPDSNVVYRFDRFTLSHDSRTLAKSGSRIPLSPQASRVLLMLVARAGEVVSREEIHRTLWGSDTFVDFEQGINTVIRRIRSALNDNAESPRFLRTVPQAGYKFIATVERFAPSSELLAPIDQQSAASSVASVDAAPFVTQANVQVGAEPRIAEKIKRIPRSTAMAVLAAIVCAILGPHSTSALRGAASNHTQLLVSLDPFSYEGSGNPPVDPRELTAKLRRRLAHIQPDLVRVVEPDVPADFRIHATLQREAHGTRADVQIVESETGQRVWSESFTEREEGADEFPLAITLRVTRAVLERINPPGRNEALLKTSVPAPALALYREARAILRLPPPQRDVDRATSLLEAATISEPRFAEAWSGIGEIWTERSLPLSGPEQLAAISKARSALNRALDLDPECAEAQNNLGFLLMRFDWSYREAERAFRTAIASDPQYVPARTNLAYLLAAMGRNDDAVAEFRHAQLLDPKSHSPSGLLAFIYLMGNRGADAEAEYRDYLLVVNRAPRFHLGMMWSAMSGRRWNDAARHLSAVLNKPVQISTDETDPAAAFNRELRLIEPLLVKMEKEGTFDSYTLACFYVHLGELEPALAALDRAILTHSRFAMFAYVDPRFATLRSDPRFRLALRRLQLIH